jgi:hypothetical protein
MPNLPTLPLPAGVIRTGPAEIPPAEDMLLSLCRIAARWDSSEITVRRYLDGLKIPFVKHRKARRYWLSTVVQLEWLATHKPAKKD